MEKSPLQLMARMASVVKGQYQETTQLKDIVEPNDNEKSNSITEPLEHTVVTKKDVKESISNSCSIPTPNAHRPNAETKKPKAFSGTAAVDCVSTDSGISSAFSEEEVEGGNTISSAVSTSINSSKPSTVISRISEASRAQPISRTVSPSQLQEDDSYRENEKKAKSYNESKKSRNSQESKVETYLNSTNSSDSSPPHDSKSSRKSEKNEPKQQVYHELTQQTLRLEKPKMYNAKLKSSFDEVKRIAFHIEKAVRHKKVFCLGGSHFPSARKALLKRGWIEVAVGRSGSHRVHSSLSHAAAIRHAKEHHGGQEPRHRARGYGDSHESNSHSNCTSGAGQGGRTSSCGENSSGNPEKSETCASDINLGILKENVEAFLKKESNFKRPPKPDVIYAKLTKNLLSNHEWCGHRRRIPWKYLLKDQTVNKFPSAFFTTKTGLLQSLQQLHWYSPQPVSSFFPRCYQVSNEEERQNFIEDYRVTACISILQWFCMEYKKHGVAGVEGGPEGQRTQARRSVIEFSLLRCKEYVVKHTHHDVDQENQHVWEHQWDQFLTDFYLVCHDNAKIQSPASSTAKTSAALFAECSHTLDNILKIRTESIVDGVMNIWIIKPGSSSRGRGISMDMKLENILAVVGSQKQGGSSSGHHSRFVIQKYIERPFLIYETKFDIRQWFLVTSWNPLVIWMYKDSYLRFCSRPFTLVSGHESIHLCNNAVQTKYANAERSSKLPPDNMWDNKMFNQFLREQGYGEKWSNSIYPLMKRTLIGTLLANQDHMEFSYKCGSAFELYGADFLLSYDLNPWLIEINSSPALGATTLVTSRLCSNLLDDIIRVTVDRKKGGRSVDTGGFELVYKQACVQPPLFVGTSLMVQGVKVNINTNQRGKFGKNYSRLLQNYYNSKPITVRLSPSNDDIKALIAQAHRSVTKSGEGGGSGPAPIITDLIDNIMSIPSCLQDAKSKVTLVREWIKQNPKSKSVDETTDKETDRSEKSGKSTPKRSQSVTESMIKGSDSSTDASHSSPTKKRASKYVSKEPTQSNFIDSEEGLKSEASTLQSPSPTHAPICDLNEPYASVMRSIAEKRIKETSTTSKLVQSSMSSKDGTTSRRRTYGSSKESVSCYGGRNRSTSVSSSTNGPKKIPKSKTPYSSVPPPPVKKKNLTKPHNGCDFERLISIADGRSGSRRGSAKDGSIDKDEEITEDDNDSTDSTGITITQPVVPRKRDEKRKDIKSPPEEGNLLSSYSQVPIPEDSNLKLSLRFSNNMLNNRRGKKAGAGINKKLRVNNSTSSHNAKGTDSTNSNNTSRKSSISSNTVASSFNSSQRRDSKPKVFKPCLPPSLLASSNVADLSDTEECDNASLRREHRNFTAIAFKSLANHFANHNTIRRRKIAARTKEQRTRGGATSPPSFKTHPGTPKSVANITGNGHRFLRKNTAKVRPSGQNLPGSRNSGDGTGSKSLKSKTNNSNQEWDNSTSVANNNTVTINGKRRSSQSKTSILLASIPLCTTQKCLIKYGCSHC